MLQNDTEPQTDAFEAALCDLWTGAASLRLVQLLSEAPIGIAAASLVALFFLYAFYVVCLRPFDYTQDLDLPSQTEKRRDIVNVTRRLRRLGTKIPPPYPNGWYMVIESWQLNVGEVKQVDCLGENFAVFRTADGKARVTRAYCPHLGANIAVGGAVKGDCIECPFHKWRFDGATGKCISIPNVDTVPSGLGVKAWTCAEIDGGVFVWFDAEGRPPQWTLSSVPEVSSGDWVYHGRNEFLVNSHIQDIPENGADVAHLNALHADHILAGTVLPTTDSWNTFGQHEWGGVWEPSDVPHEARVELTHKISLISKLLTLQFDVSAKQMGPACVNLTIRHRIGRLVFLQTITPLEPLLQKVVHRIYAPRCARPFANFMMWGETVMFHRDVMIWNSKEFVNAPMLSKSDKCIKSFRKWFSQFYSESSLSFKEAFIGPRRDLVDW